MGFKAYHGSVMNVLDLLQYISTAVIIVSNLIADRNLLAERSRIVASLSLFILWVKFFDWLRLFEQTAFYVKLLTKTLSDI